MVLIDLVNLCYTINLDTAVCLTPVLVPAPISQRSSDRRLRLTEAVKYPEQLLRKAQILHHQP